MSNLIERVMGALERVLGPVAPSVVVPNATEAVVNVTALGTTQQFAAPVYSAGFLVAINRVLGMEGGLVDDPKDPGGLTQWGISQRSYPKTDIRALTREDAVGIYYRDFWTAISAEQMPPALSYQALDFAVHSGPVTAIKKLQSAAGATPDGKWGPATRAAVLAVPVPKLLMRFLAERLDFLRQTPVWKADNSGLAARIAADLRYAALDS